MSIYSKTQCKIQNTGNKKNYICFLVFFNNYIYIKKKITSCHIFMIFFKSVTFFPAKHTHTQTVLNPSDFHRMDINEKCRHFSKCGVNDDRMMLLGWAYWDWSSCNRATEKQMHEGQSLLPFIASSKHTQWCIHHADAASLVQLQTGEVITKYNETSFYIHPLYRSVYNDALKPTQRAD